MTNAAAANSHSLRRTAMIRLDMGQIHFHVVCLHTRYSVMTLTSTVISMKYAKFSDAVDDFHCSSDFVVHRFRNELEGIR